MNFKNYDNSSYALLVLLFFFFFNDTATTEIYTLSLHDALPIRPTGRRCAVAAAPRTATRTPATLARRRRRPWPDRKSTRLNSSHGYISYAVFCLKKKKHKNLGGVRDSKKGRHL